MYKGGGAAALSHLVRLMPHLNIPQRRSLLPEQHRHRVNGGQRTGLHEAEEEDAVFHLLASRTFATSANSNRHVAPIHT